jgi:hypothetical protein
MGLLDDAIRDHLELKRLRGADPGEVAREQQEALDPNPRDEHAAPDHDSPAAWALSPEAASEATPVDTAPPVDHLANAPQPAYRPEVSNGGQETDELDMRTVMDEHEGALADNVLEARPAAPDPLVGASSGEHPEEHSLEWEVPGESSRKPATHAADNRHLPGDDNPIGTAGEADAAGPAEDVLEETPEFLRDTPEQQHLSFEQHPPRDFDFGK